MFRRPVRFLFSPLRVARVLGWVLFLSASAARAQNYTFLTIDDPNAGTFGGTNAQGISGGNIVGYYEDSLIKVHGFIYNIATGNYTTLNDPDGVGNLSGQGTRAYGIDGGNVVGDYVDGSGAHHGFLYSIASGNYTTFDDPEAGNIGGSGTFPKGVSGGNIVGTYTDGNFTQHSFLYNGTDYANLTEDPNANLTLGGTQATGISGGNIVGYYTDSNSDTHGFLYDIATTTFTANIDDPNAISQTQAEGIAGGNIAGYYLDNSGDHGFVFNGTTYITVDDPLGGSSGGGMGTYAYGIDSSGDVVGHYADGLGTPHGFLATLGPVKTVPVITAQPASVAVLAGKSASFTVKATGTGTLSYQWYFGSKTISDANKATYTIAKVASANAGKYAVVVSNANGHTASNFVTLTILVAPTIVTQPKAASVSKGATAKFTVKASGSATLTYQWQKSSKNLANGGGISGVTTATLTITKVTTTNAGSYRVIVKNAGGSVTSASVKLTVKS
jgi:hypothetical protein